LRDRAVDDGTVGDVSEADENDDDKGELAERRRRSGGPRSAAGRLVSPGEGRSEESGNAKGCGISAVEYSSEEEEAGAEEEEEEEEEDVEEEEEEEEEEGVEEEEEGDAVMSLEEEEGEARGENERDEKDTKGCVRGRSPCIVTSTYTECGGAVAHQLVFVVGDAVGVVGWGGEQLTDWQAVNDLPILPKGRRNTPRLENTNKPNKS
jgi:hypothetical protein